MKKSSKNNKYYKNLNTIRVLSCLAVLLYHLGYLKGGYLAVNIFFLLSGYLHIITLENKKIDLKKYYQNKFKKIYVPLLIVVFTSIAITTSLKNIYWLNIKNETTSVLFGYNNFWQISTNLDYFTRQVDSPFMHLWYIAILMQLELLFPLVYALLKKAQSKISKKSPIIISMFLGIISAIYFITLTQNGNLINAYYNTFARCYTFLWGIALGFYHVSYKPRFLRIATNNAKIIFSFYLTISILMFAFINSSSPFFLISMLIINLIGARLIDYATLLKNNPNFINKISNITYEIYLTQYPVIFIFQYLNINHYLKLILTLFAIAIFSLLIHYAFVSKQAKKIQLLIISIMLIISSYGFFKYITSKTYEKEIEELKAVLKENELIMKEQQDKYNELTQRQEDDWNKELEKLENPDNYPELVQNLNITFIGDSVMLGAMNNIIKKFPNSYFDAKESRQIYTATSIIEEIKEDNKLGEAVVIHLGSNGDCNTCKDDIMKQLSDKQVFWLNTTNDQKVNASLNKLSEKYQNLTIIDWYTLSSGHEDWFYYDGIHLPPKGRSEYTNIIYEAILNIYKDIFASKKAELIATHKQELKNKLAIYGNDILLYNFDEISKNYSNAKLIIQKELTFKEIKEHIKQELKEDTLSNEIFIALDDDIIISNEEYEELINLCPNQKIYILATSKPLNNLTNNKNVTIINFYKEIKKNKDYLLKDGIHLTEKGNNALINLLKTKLKDNN